MCCHISGHHWRSVLANAAVEQDRHGDPTALALLGSFLVSLIPLEAAPDAGESGRVPLSLQLLM